MAWCWIPWAFLSRPRSGTSNRLPLQLSATDANQGPLTFAIVTPPANGMLSGTPPKLTYTPNKDFFGLDSFAFRARDGETDSPPAVIVIEVKPVNDVPSFTAGED